MALICCTERSTSAASSFTSGSGQSSKSGKDCQPPTLLIRLAWPRSRHARIACSRPGLISLALPTLRTESGVPNTTESSGASGTKTTGRLLRQCELRGTGLRARRDKRERVDEASHVGGLIIAIGRKHRGLKRNQTTVKEIERRQCPPATVGLIDGELASVFAVDAAERIHQELLLVLEEEGRLAEKNGAIADAVFEVHHVHF